MIRKILRIFGLKKLDLALRLIYRKSYFVEIGFVLSWLTGFPVDKNNNNYPWWTYCFTAFLTPRITKDMKIFEYGAGNSTIYLSNLVKHITAVEHDREWKDKLSSQVHDNVKLIYIPEDEYVDIISSQKDEVGYDIIIIDGIKRNECAYKSVDRLTKQGVIIFDDSNRDEYIKAFDYLVENKFKRLDFVGFSPCSINLNSTSIFYRDSNILKI